MNGYVPNSPLLLVGVLVALVMELLLGVLITRLPNSKIARVFAWLLVVGMVLGIERWTVSEPAGIRMLAIIGALLFGMKVVVSVEEHAAGRKNLNPRNWLLFTIGWPGMRPSTFAEVPGPAKNRWAELLKQGGRNLACGVILFVMAWGISRIPGDTLTSPARVWLATACLLPAISLMMHFGIFNLLAGGWRLLGADCHALFRAPLRSTSLAEFWGRRWNLAFSEM
ncbi:MAG: hypothetical protein KDA84_14675, partial [Planctomycetaceae bacterium]|nr:hypothetical protein [Planctomycetaceae bacterium]